MEIPSDSGITFNVQPKMKALEIGEKAREAILSRKFDQVTIVFLYLGKKDIIRSAACVASIRCFQMVVGKGEYTKW